MWSKYVRQVPFYTPRAPIVEPNCTTWERKEEEEKSYVCCTGVRTIPSRRSTASSGTSSPPDWNTCRAGRSPCLPRTRRDIGNGVLNRGRCSGSGRRCLSRDPSTSPGTPDLLFFFLQIINLVPPLSRLFVCRRNYVELCRRRRSSKTCSSCPIRMPGGGAGWCSHDTRNLWAGWPNRTGPSDRRRQTRSCSGLASSPKRASPSGPAPGSDNLHGAGSPGATWRWMSIQLEWKSWGFLLCRQNQLIQYGSR